MKYGTKRLTTLVFVLAAALFSVNCQCAFASLPPITQEVQVKSCHSHHKEPSKEDCCSRCDIDNAAILKKTEIIKYDDLFHDAAIIPTREKIKFSQNFDKNLTLDLFDYPSHYLSTCLPRGPPAV